MRCSVFILSLMLCLASHGQEDCFNPDLSGDGHIGSADLVVLLGYYNLVWPPDTSFSCAETVDHHGYSYAVQQVGEQCWFAENCRYLPAVNPPDETAFEPVAYVLGYEGSDTTEAMATTHYQELGALYNWYALEQWNLCPSGWHPASDEDWQMLEAAIGMPEIELDDTGWRGTTEGEELKDDVLWNGTNLHGMAIRSGGVRYTNGTFGSSEGTLTHIWTSTTSDDEPWHRIANLYNDSFYRGNNMTEGAGGSVRCVMD